MLIKARTTSCPLRMGSSFGRVVRTSDFATSITFLLTFYSLAVTLRTAMFKIKIFCMMITFTCFMIAFMCFVWISEQTATFTLYCITDWFL